MPLDPRLRPDMPPCSAALHFSKPGALYVTKVEHTFPTSSRRVQRRETASGNLGGDLSKGRNRVRSLQPIAFCIGHFLAGLCDLVPSLLAFISR